MFCNLKIYFFKIPVSIHVGGLGMYGEKLQAKQLMKIQRLTVCLYQTRFTAKHNIV